MGTIPNIVAESTSFSRKLYVLRNSPYLRIVDACAIAVMDSSFPASTLGTNIVQIRWGTFTANSGSPMKCGFSLESSQITN